MTNSKETKDKHFSLFGHKIARLFEPSKRFVNPYVKEGMTVADLGCGLGYYSLHFAKILGPKGKVFSVDSDERTILALEKKKEKRGFKNIEPHAASAADLSFIEDESIDFIFANGLLCCVALTQQESSVEEIKRILKPNGLAYISAAKGFGSYMTEENWEQILQEFKVQKRKDKRSEWTAEVRKKAK